MAHSLSGRSLLEVIAHEAGYRQALAALRPLLRNQTQFDTKMIALLEKRLAAIKAERAKLEKYDDDEMLPLDPEDAAKAASKLQKHRKRRANQPPWHQPAKNDLKEPATFLPPKDIARGGQR